MNKLNKSGLGSKLRLLTIEGQYLQYYQVQKDIKVDRLKPDDQLHEYLRKDQMKA